MTLYCTPTADLLIESDQRLLKNLDKNQLLDELSLLDKESFCKFYCCLLMLLIERQLWNFDRAKSLGDFQI